ncbi:serine hydroxymethyltransferase, partial [Bifidobacterium longum]
AEKRLDEAYITANKNTIPFDPNGAFVTSGIRLGTPAVTTRGMKEEDMVDIAKAIDLCLTHNNEKEARETVINLTTKYPLYDEYNIFNE